MNENNPGLPRDGIGGNNPPDDATLLIERLDVAAAVLRARCNTLLGGEARAPEITSDEQAGLIGDFITQISAAIKSADTLRATEKEPHLIAGRTIDGYFKALASPLEQLRTRMQAKTTTWLLAKKRKAEQEAAAEAKRLRDLAAKQERTAARLAKAKLADDAADHKITAEETRAAAGRVEAVAAKATTADLSRTRGAAGSVMSLSTKWVGEVTTLRDVDLEALRPYLTIDALIKALNLAVRQGVREVKGCTIREVNSTNAR